MAEKRGLNVKRVEKLLRAGVPGKHTDGDVRGLMLCVEGKKSAHWLLRWQRDGRVSHMGLGSARDLPLAAARDKAREQRERIASGTDPLEMKRKDREAQREIAAKRITFRQATERYHKDHARGWTSEKHAGEFLSSLQRWAFPLIGNIDVSSIDRDAVLRVLEQEIPRGGGRFWDTKSITADRVRSRMQNVIDWAEARGYRASGTPNPARWRGFLDQLLPAPRKIAPVKNMAAVPYTELPALMQLLAADQNVAAQCLRFIILTAARLGEALKARWTEIDLEAAEWTVPASRMKGRREHRVPLCSQATDLLRALYVENGNPYLFISAKTPGSHVVESTVGLALRNAGRRETIHGFRASFKTWAEERTNYPGLIIEMSLAHAVGNAVERSYRRTDLTVKRAKLMQEWGKFCCTPPVQKSKGDKVVVPLRGSSA
jgi:integrase